MYKICRLCCFPSLEFPRKKTTFKFHKVVYRHYSGEVGNAYITLWQIIQVTTHQILSEWSEFRRRYDKHFGFVFLGHGVEPRQDVFRWLQCRPVSDKRNLKLKEI